MDLYDVKPEFRPLADRMRPTQLSELVGQAHLVSAGKPLHRAIVHNKLHSMVFWGPPGTGKTTFAQLIAKHCDAHFVNVSAVLSGVKDIRSAVDQARQLKDTQGQASVIFVDEVHRFNKVQQDAFLPHIEDGTICFIGATTENPSFELNNALLSRVRTYVLQPLDKKEIRQLIEQALEDETRGLGGSGIVMRSEVQDQLAAIADGDARCALNLLEIAADIADDIEGRAEITESTLAAVSQQNPRRFDKGGDVFYEQISALHKSVRGTAPDAALYWLCRMLDGGCDPRYIARRVVRMASEDIGNADPRGLQIALDAWQAFERLGSPEGELAIAQAVTYLACAPKSNAVYKAYNDAAGDARRSGSLPVPLHLRNAPTQFMKNIGYSEGYHYPHDEEDAYTSGQHYFPEALGERQYYQPVERGLEIRIKEKLQALRNKS